MEHIYTYILLLNDGKYYTGITKNITLRLSQHRAGMSKSTKWSLPLQLIWLQVSSTRIEARELEVKIKSTGAKRFLKTYPHGNHSKILLIPLNDPESHFYS